LITQYRGNETKRNETREIGIDVVVVGRGYYKFWRVITLFDVKYYFDLNY
jgi:hypothetical protein